MVRTEIRIAGTGGMGVVLAGVILGHAAAVYANLEALQSQSYGSEARGTAAKSEVIISDGPIRYPKVQESDYFVAMSQKALDLYLPGARKGSVVMTDPDLVDSTGVEGYELIEVPAMRTADELGLRLVSNMVMLGALVQKSNLFSLEYLEKALADLISSKALDLDVDAVRTGAKLI
ncbi:MAG: 2-oxoacid:ferredoxin oxidoreductase subunit gamma [Candidatus Thorarchaeota archaeon]|nr:MAG: 2-oxoacid:ferredoxin oxidoreductase subunit gamma [Candidatus Thorarchaeota archaeon]RLI60182.1 MAG: 2-oxoacid:ferredoxin oxidoreductase subunit gamma [Candidatus Thorarchaeota archaeon]